MSTGGPEEGFVPPRPTRGCGEHHSLPGGGLGANTQPLNILGAMKRILGHKCKLLGLEAG